MNQPLGGKLIERIATKAERQAMLRLRLPVIPVKSERGIEAWNIATGAYSPLEGFSGRKDFMSVLDRLTLANGIFWPVPIILDIDERQAKRLKGHDRAFLRDPIAKKNVAIIDIGEIYRFPKRYFCKKIFGTASMRHPGVRKTMQRGAYLVGGRITLLAEGAGSFAKYTLPPKETRRIFASRKWRTIVGFHTRNVPHRGHEHIQREALKKTDGIFLNPLMGEKKKGDFSNEIVLKSYIYLSKHILPAGKSLLGVLNYSPYYAGPREALLTAVIRKNFGCTHFIIGRDHTGVGNFYKPSDYEHAIKKYGRAMGISIFHFKKAFYCRGCKGMTLEGLCEHGKEMHVYPSGTLVRSMIENKSPVPAEMMRPRIVDLLFKEKNLFV